MVPIHPPGPEPVHQLGPAGLWRVARYFEKRSRCPAFLLAITAAFRRIAVSTGRTTIT